MKADCALEDAVENIDIGGRQCLEARRRIIRDVVVLVDPKDYDRALAELKSGGVSRD